MKLYLPGMRLESLLNVRWHWAKRAAYSKVKRATTRLELAARFVPINMMWPVQVTIVRIAPRSFDSDNLAAACKPVRDGVADWLGCDDGDMVKVAFFYEQRKGGAGEYSVEIRIGEDSA